jgi:hypothetical protein
MAGDDLQRVKKGRGPFAVVVTTNQRRTLTASRCTLCGLVELYAR